MHQGKEEFGEEKEKKNPYRSKAATESSLRKWILFV
jgi:hypothetical protein